MPAPSLTEKRVYRRLRTLSGSSTVVFFGFYELFHHLSLRGAHRIGESSFRGGRSSVGRAQDCGSWCRGFETRRSPQFLIADPLLFFGLWIAPLCGDALIFI